MKTQGNSAEVGIDVQLLVRCLPDSTKDDLLKKLERERDDARNIAHDLAVELYSSQHIPEKSNAGRLIKKAMSLLPNADCPPTR